MTALPDARLRHLAPKVHALGPRPLFELLRELRDGANLAATVESYAKLPGDFIRMLGGDKIPPLRAVSS
jgi:hypothetical protein